jgi:hypothetical protein
MNPSASQFPTSNVKVHASLENRKNPDTYERSKLRGALRTKGKLDAFGSSNTFDYKGNYGIEPQAEVGVADENRDGTYIISDNPDKNPTRFKQ